MLNRLLGRTENAAARGTRAGRPAANRNKARTGRGTRNAGRTRMRGRMGMRGRRGTERTGGGLGRLIGSLTGRRRRTV